MNVLNTVPARSFCAGFLILILCTPFAVGHALARPATSPFGSRPLSTPPATSLIREASLPHRTTPGQVATKYAVLINGNSGYSVYINTLTYMYTTLINKYGYLKQDIFVLSYDGSSVDLDGDGQNDINYSATKANVLAVLDTVIARTHVAGNYVVFVYGNDHGDRIGGTNEAYMTLYNGGTFTASEFDAFVVKLQTHGAPGDLRVSGAPRPVLRRGLH